MLSAFLPANFDSSKPIAIMAGQGLYPQLVINNVRKHNLDARIIAAEDETSPDLFNSFPEDRRLMMRVGQIGKLLRYIKDTRPAYVIMAGQITPKRLFHGLHPDLTALRLLLSLKQRNAETIFGTIAAEIEKLGATILDARSFMDEHLATPGSMTRDNFPVPEHFLDHGINITREIARLDIGQGAVFRKGTVLAVEAYEGTDEMIKRAGTFNADQSFYVKTVKARQDYRFDVPCFGTRTLETMRTSGISSAALEAGSVILLDKPAVLEKASSLHISLFGFK